MRAPTVKRLVEWLDISEEQAKTVRGLIKGTVDPESIEGTADWVRQCFGRPADDELILDAIGRVIETFGTVGMRLDGDHEPLFCYCNSGDSYAGEVWYDCREERFFLSSFDAMASRFPNLRTM